MEDGPLFKITRGTPTAEELAALVGIVLGRSRPPATTAAPPASTWARSGRPGAMTATRPAPRPARGAWRESGLPR